MKQRLTYETKLRQLYGQDSYRSWHYGYTGLSSFDRTSELKKRSGQKTLRRYYTVETIAHRRIVT